VIVAATVVIDERFCGPPASANGGYACGMTAQALSGPAEVTLRVPPPLGRPMALEHAAGRARLLDGDVLVAEGRDTTVELEVPEAVSFADAQEASTRYPWRDRHPYPTCFVCGPRRTPGDGLCVYPGPVEGRAVFAAPWTPDASLAGAGGPVRREFVWAALDCPSGIVTDLFGGVGRMLLGRLAADLRRPVVAGADYVVQAWPLERDGRKLHTASALFGAAGELHAVARAVWIEVEPAA
jgi:hypothetical protein